MIPLYFGTGHRLFGIFHLPDPGTGRRAGVVLCYPYGQDYVYSFRTFRTLANRLARSGFPVLRFDYSGTGDSADDEEGVSVSQWTADVSDAIDQIRAHGHSTLALVGYRLGAALAATAAVQHGGVARLVLWDPVIDGPEYVSALLRRHRSWFRELAHQIPRSRELATSEDLLGFRLSGELRTGLERLNLISLDASPAKEILIVCTENYAAHAELGRRFHDLGSNVHVKLVEDQQLPSKVPGLQIGLVPNRVLSEIDSWFRASAND